MKTLINDIKHIGSSSIQIMTHYLNDYIRVGLIIYLITAFVALPIINVVFNAALRSLGLQGLNEGNFYALLNNPKAIFFIVLSVILLVLVIFIEIAIYLTMIDGHMHGQTFKLQAFIKVQVKQLWRIFAFQFFFLFLYLVLIIPVGGLNILSNLTSDLYLPHFISGELLKSTTGSIVYYTSLILLAYLNLRLIFTIYIMVIKKEKSLFKAIKRSWIQTRRQTFRYVLIILFVFITFALVFIMIQLGLIFFVSIFDNYMKWIAPFVAGFVLTLMGLVAIIFVNIAKIVYSTTLHYLYDSDLLIEKRQNYQKLGQFKHLIWILFFFIFISNTFVLVNRIYQPDTLIIAHRGGFIKEAVENTIESLEAAIPYNPDYIELDVMETKDQQLIVFHDLTLRRLANDSRAVADLTLEEITSIRLTSGPYQAYVPSFDEFAKRSKELGFNLLVEIKLHGNESEDMVTHVLETLKKHDLLDQAIIQSFDQDILDQVKSYSPQVRTSLIIAIHLGGLPSKSSNYITIEDFSARTRIIDEAQDNQIGVLVWTINQRHLMIQYMMSSVDGIITNELSMAQELKESLSGIHTFSGRLKIEFERLFSS